MLSFMHTHAHTSYMHSHNKMNTLAHFVVVALIVGSLEVIDYAYRFCVNIGCSEP